MQMTIIVTGGRDYSDRETLFAYLDRLHAETPITLLVHGSAKGADALAWEWAVENGLPWIAHGPDWKKHGRAAGPIRNREMLKENPSLVVAFPGGRGTADMCQAARDAGVKVIEVSL